MDLDAYRRQGEAFVSALGREHYQHFAGLKPTLEVEGVYEAYADLFTPDAVANLRDAGSQALLEFCVEGLIGRATALEAAQLAGREAELELDLDGETVPFRRATIDQGNEPDRGRREALELARLEAIADELDPLHERVLERSREVTAQLGWPSMTELSQDLSGLDLRALASDAEDLLARTDAEYEGVAEPHVRAVAGAEGELRRSDLPAFFRAPALDRHFPGELLVETLAATVSGLGVEADGRVRLDAEVRPTKSPRAFCAAVRVPDEVYLVISPHGGRDDYETILHEAGHSQHYAHVARDAAFERRHLGDNSTTEAYAFLLQRLAADPAWLERHLAVRDPAEIVEHARIAKLVLVRRYAAKLVYEVELHETSAEPAALRRLYARRLSRALRIDWPEETWLSDVDPFFYAARYLRAWALEAELARDLSASLGPEWFTRAEAGARLRELWAQGQPWNASELLGREPDLAALSDELVGPV